jgi:hypothetical protein
VAWTRRGELSVLKGDKRTLDAAEAAGYPSAANRHGPSSMASDFDAARFPEAMHVWLRIWTEWVSKGARQVSEMEDALGRYRDKTAHVRIVRPNLGGHGSPAYVAAKAQYVSAQDWCVQQWGEQGKVWASRMDADVADEVHLDFFFESPRQATLFKLSMDQGGMRGPA